MIELFLLKKHCIDLLKFIIQLGLTEEAKKAAKILGYNYKSSQWYERSYKVFNKKYKA